MYVSTKTYGHAVGFSACFRQHRAQSHCKYLHGYSLAVRLEFEADALDELNWVVDFGSLKDVKIALEQMFDHTMLVAQDDPELDFFMELNRRGLARIRVVAATGCEAFAKQVYIMAHGWLVINKYVPRVRLRSVEVAEHGANSAIYTGGADATNETSVPSGSNIPRD
jgi:6-pyruvoyltetrahydropterin/6-carboxytetrahydropterin synthase